MRPLLSALMILVALPVAMADDHDDAEPPSVVVKAGAPEFTISLPANPTTGYQWFLEFADPDLIEALGRDYEGPGNGLAGAGGTDHWHFRVRDQAFAVPRITEVEFVYLRPWAPDDDPEDHAVPVVILPGQ